MAKSASALNAGLANPYDQKTQIRRLSFVFAKEKSEDRKAKKLGNVQNESCGEETRKSRPVL